MNTVLSAVCDQRGKIVQQWAEYPDTTLCLTCDAAVPMVYPEDELPPPSGSWFAPDLGTGD